jgi:hypothetical protein
VKSHVGTSVSCVTLDVAALAVVVGIDICVGVVSVNSRRGNVRMIFVVVEGGNNNN